MLRTDSRTIMLVTPISIKAEFISHYQGKFLNFEIGDGLSIHFLPTSPLVGFAAYQEGAFSDYHPPDNYPSLEIRYGKGAKKKSPEEEEQLFDSFPIAEPHEWTSPPP